MHTVSAGEYTNIDGFARDMAVYNTAEDDLPALVLALDASLSTDGKAYSWESDAVSDLGDNWTSGTQGWGFDVGACIAVNDDPSDGVHRDIDNLEQRERLGVFSGIF